MSRSIGSLDPPVVEVLADFLLRLDNEYLMETFSLTPHDAAYSFDYGFIAVCDDGDIASGRIGGIVKEWWKVSEGQAKLVQHPEFQGSQEGDQFDRTPVLKIFINGEQFVLGERYGPALSCRRCGNVADLKRREYIKNLPVIWRSCPEQR